MGRLKKNRTPEELAIKRREYVKKYYWKNKEKIDAKARDRYNRRKDKTETPGTEQT